MGIQFIGKLIITPNQGVITGQTGNYFLYENYTNAQFDGWITFPNHIDEMPNNDASLIGQSGYAIYIKRYDTNGTDYSSILDSLIGQSGNITLIQGSNYATLAFDSSAFIYSNDEYFYDNVMAGGIPGAITLTTLSSLPFNYNDPITIAVNNVPIATATPTPTPAATATPTPEPTATPTPTPTPSAPLCDITYNVVALDLTCDITYNII